MRKPKIAIVGASIAGSACAVVLDRLGFDITIFERSKSSNAMVDRGAGMWLPNELINKLIELDILSKDFSYIPIHERPIYTYKRKLKKENLLTSHPIKSSAIHWFNLYEDLKKHCSEDKIIYDAEVIQIKQNTDDVITLIMNNNQSYDFDYCIFTDGVNSIGRQYLFPEIKPVFADTIIWRGTLDCADKEIMDRLLHKAIFYVCERGHFLMYPIHNPIKNTSHTYKINWLFYEKVDAAHRLFTNNPEKARQNITKGTMPTEYRQYLHTLAKKYLPPHICNIINLTEEPFIQAMHEMLIPSYIGNHICLIGDAGITARPHVGAGATKALQDALALGEQLKINSDIQTAFKIWNENQHKQGSQLFQLGQKLGNLFVTNMPDWNQINKQQMDELWQKVIDSSNWYILKDNEQALTNNN